MPRRGAIALLLTAAGLAFLLGFRTPDMATTRRQGAIAIVSSAPVGGSPAATSRPAAGAGAPAVGGRPSPTARPGTIARPGATAQPAATAQPGATAPPAAGAALHDGTYTGSSVGFRFGNVQVQVVISGGRIASVTSLQMPDGDRRSQRITDGVEPILREEALAAQSGAIDVISGATYTSTAYAQSLQSALDQAAGG